jgi:hypothetical protein
LLIAHGPSIPTSIYGEDMKILHFVLLSGLFVPTYFGCDRKVKKMDDSTPQVFNGQEAQNKKGIFKLSSPCSAVLVAPGTLLSAGHCFGGNWELPPGKQPSLNGPLKIYYEFMNKSFPVTKIQVAPHKVINQISVNPDDINIPGFDLALITFEDWGEIPTDHIRNIIPADGDKKFRLLTTPATIQGYGWTDERVVPAVKQQEGKLYWVSRWGLYGQEIYFTGPSNACGGDSGGPVFDSGRDGSQVEGITIRHVFFYLDKYCDKDDTIATNLAHPVVREWIRAASNGVVDI